MLVKQISPNEAFLKLKNEQNSVLIDVRSEAEFIFVGVVDLSAIKKESILLPWQIFPAMALNQAFATSLEEKLQEKFGSNKIEASLIFICRTGGRSDMAANHMTKFGYKNCFNIIGGFEGDVDNNNHRGTINGWKASNLAWRQQ